MPWLNVTCTVYCLTNSNIPPYPTTLDPQATIEDHVEVFNSVTVSRSDYEAQSCTLMD